MKKTTTPHAWSLVSILLLIALSACSAGIEEGGGDGGPSGAAPDLLSYGGDGARHLDAKTCGATAFQIEPAHPNVLVLFDRSCSMRRRYDLPTGDFGTGPTDPKTRWFMARQAVDKLTKAYQTRVRFGLMVFPRPTKGCGDLPQLNVTPAVMRRSAILSALDQTAVVPFTLCPPKGQPGTGPQPTETPTAEAMSAATALKELKDPARASYILLITDGMATCGATAASLGAQTATLKAQGVKTAVVGFGEADQPTAVAMLGTMATQGGMSKPGGKQAFWLATDPASLQQALDSLVSQAVSCSFSLKQTPPAKDKLYAFHDGQNVAEGGADGWTYDAAANAITFHGASCQRLKQGQVKNVSLVFGCPDPACVPSKEVCDGFDNDCDGKVDEGCIE